jgi:hypothetical protein
VTAAFPTPAGTFWRFPGAPISKQLSAYCRNTLIREGADAHFAKESARSLCVCVYCPSCALIISSIFALRALRLNDAGACIGGYSTAVIASLPTSC